MLFSNKSGPTTDCVRVFGTMHRHDTSLWRCWMRSDQQEVFPQTHGWILFETSSNNRISHIIIIIKIFPCSNFVHKKVQMLMIPVYQYCQRRFSRKADGKTSNYSKQFRKSKKGVYSLRLWLCFKVFPKVSKIFQMF